MSTETIRLLGPEIVLVAAAVLIYIGGAFSNARKTWSWIAAAGIIEAAVVLWLIGGGTATGGPLRMDPLAYYTRWMALGLGGLLVLLASRPLNTPGVPEYVGSLILTVAGLMLVCGARELVLLFVGLELISIPTYILLYLGRRTVASQESAAKYFFLSILASAMLLYGFSFLYGATGAIELSRIGDRLAVMPAGFDMLVKVALVLILAGLSFKIAAVPFHFYAPDVYQGTTHPGAALLSVIPKAAGLVVLVRIVAMTMSPETASYAWRITLVLSVLTMSVGNVLALWQNNLRRLLAYSSIAQAGYMLIGLTVALAPAGAPGKWDGTGALLFYLCVYAAATLGTFAALEYLGRGDRSIDAVDELAGLGRTRPLVAAALGLFMFSLAGIPPLAGFWGKLVLFGSALSVDPGAAGGLRPWFVALAVIGVLNAAVAAAYYLRIVAVMYFRTPLAAPKAQGGAGVWAAVVACAVLVIAIGVYPRPLLNESNRAGGSVVVEAEDSRQDNRRDVAAVLGAEKGRHPSLPRVLR